MKHITSFLFLLAVAGALQASPPRKPSSVIPTSKVMTHDPVLAKQGDTYYLFATGQGISVMSSKDMEIRETGIRQGTPMGGGSHQRL